MGTASTLLSAVLLLGSAFCSPTISDVRRAVASSSDVSDPAASPYNPMYPFMSLKPFLPAKPTFFPPVVDPNYFIGQKAAMLNSLFGSKTAGPLPVKNPATKEAKRTLPMAGFSPVPFGPSVFAGKKTAFLNQLFKQLSTTPAPDPSQDISQDVTPTADPNVAMYKKMALLSILLKQLETPSTTSSSKRDAPVDDIADLTNLFLGSSLLNADKDTDSTADKSALWSSYPVAKSPITKPTIVPPNFWSPFAAKPSPPVKPTIVPPGFWAPFAAKPSPPVKPTIVPPGFWAPFIQPPSITPKPTIVPPSFWLPFAPGTFGANKTSVSPVDPSAFIDKKTAFLQTLFSTLQTTPTPPVDPTDIYTQKVNDFLDKLFTSLQPEQPSQVARRGVLPPTTTDPVSSLMDAKSKIISSIITEMTSVKDSMLDTVDDIIKKQKEVATAASSFVPGKKPFASPYAGMWGPPSTMGKPTPDPTAPFKQKLKFLDQLFDGLAKMQKDVADSVNKAISKLPTTPAPPADSLLLALLKERVQGMANSTSSDGDKKVVQDELQRRGIKMAVHQGYQSLPPGAEEILQAGGGGDVQGQEGGGLRLQELQDTPQDLVFNMRPRGHHNHH